MPILPVSPPGARIATAPAPTSTTVWPTSGDTPQLLERPRRAVRHRLQELAEDAVAGLDEHEPRARVERARVAPLAVRARAAAPGTTAAGAATETGARSRRQYAMCMRRRTSSSVS